MNFLAHLLAHLLVEAAREFLRWLQDSSGEPWL